MFRNRGVTNIVMQASSRHMEDAVLDALGNSVRRDILRLVHDNPMDVGGIAARFSISRPAVSRHLAILEHAGLLAFEEDGTRNVYRGDPAGLDALRRFLDGFWDEAEPRLRMVAENLGNADE